MPRLTNDKHQSLNESISHVANPAAALARAEEYAELLEEVITALCEELEIDPQELVEDIQTAERRREMSVKSARANAAAYSLRGRTDTEARKIRKAAADQNKQDSKEHRSKAVYAAGGRKITDPKEGKREMKASSKRFRAHKNREFKKREAGEIETRAKMSPYDRALHDAEMGGYQGSEARRIAANRSRDR
jgi:hypothetical protein